MTRTPSFSQELRHALLLMRPDQWTILTFQFMVPVLLTAPAAQGGGCWFNPASGAVLFSAWVLWVIFLNGGTLAFNSAYDKDTGPVAYLSNPPKPPAWLAMASLSLMIAGTVLSRFIVGSAFSLIVAVCLVLSVLYSHPAVRLKSRPGWDLLVNMIGYGGATTWAGLLAGKAAYFGADVNACAAGGWRNVPWPGLQGSVVLQLQESMSGGAGWMTLGFVFLFGSFYPLTQLYQMQDDLERGDRTLCTALGGKRSLQLALLLGLVAGGFLAWGLMMRNATWSLAFPALALSAWSIHLIQWLNQEAQMEPEEQEKRMYRALKLWALMDVAVVTGWYF